MKCKLFPKDRFTMRVVLNLTENSFYVYYVLLMAICLANTVYFGILRVFG